MKAYGEVAVRLRRSRAEGERLVSEFVQSGLGRKEFCAAHGLNVFTLDAWRKRIAQPRRQEKIVPVEIVDNRVARRDTRPAAGVTGIAQFRVVLAEGLRIEVEPGFDATELRRLITALDGVALCGSSSQPV